MRSRLLAQGDAIVLTTEQNDKLDHYAEPGTAGHDKLPNLDTADIGHSAPHPADGTP